MKGIDFMPGYQCLEAEGTVTAIIGSTYELTTLIAEVDGVPEGAIYMLRVDAEELRHPDTFDIRIYTRTYDDDEWKTAVYQSGTGPQERPIVSPPIACETAIKFTLRQSVGLGRTYSWEVIRF